MPQVTVDGLAFEVEEFGHKHHPAILLIMGLAGQLVQWDRSLCEGLASQGFRVVRFDNRDVGLSAKIHGKNPNLLVRVLLYRLFGYSPTPPYRISDMAKDVIGILDALEIDKAHLVGMSMGGLIAQVLALQHEDRVHSLTAFFTPSANPKFVTTDRKVLAALTRKINPKATAEERATLAVDMFKLVSGPKYPVDAQLEKRIREGVARSFYPSGIARQLAAILAEPPLAPRLPNLKAPILVIHGTDDKLVPIANGREIAATAPRSQLVEIEGMGHTIPTVLFPQFIELITGHARAAMGLANT